MLPKLRLSARIFPVTHRLRSLLLDITAVVGLLFAGALAASWLDLPGRIANAPEAGGSLQGEALLTALFLVPIGLAFVAVRRWLAVRHALREHEAAVARLADAARLEGILLAARTLQHEMNNQLGMTVGYAELLADDPSLSSEQRELARTALNGAERAAALLSRLCTRTRVKLRHVGGPDGPVLELAASASTGASAGRLGEGR
jgi:signal transduction histidine kinase